ncbi:MAG: hypothetical protein ABIJ56_10440 [Pseudomonadota bacterium]
MKISVMITYFFMPTMAMAAACSDNGGPGDAGSEDVQREELPPLETCSPPNVNPCYDPETKCFRALIDEERFEVSGLEVGTCRTGESTMTFYGSTTARGIWIAWISKGEEDESAATGRYLLLTGTGGTSESYTCPNVTVNITDDGDHLHGTFCGNFRNEGGDTLHIEGGFTRIWDDIGSRCF